VLLGSQCSAVFEESALEASLYLGSHPGASRREEEHRYLNICKKTLHGKQLFTLSNFCQAM